uniref:Krueppel-like factor 15 n=1 Tax=Cacopsylla melanoneura TaxID=428564 RepID=A0A8D8T9T1_9HEMI
MIDSLDRNDNLLSDLGLFSSEYEVMLDLDPNLAFENISWMNEDFGRDIINDKDHTYSQQDGRKPLGHADHLETETTIHETVEPHCGTRLTENNDSKNGANNLNEVIDKNDETLHIEHNVSNNHAMKGQIDLTDQIRSEQLSDENVTLDPEQSSTNSSLSFFLEETNCQNFDLNGLLQTEFEINNPLGNNPLQEVISQPEVSRQDLDHLVGNEDHHTLTALVSNLETLNVHTTCGFKANVETLFVNTLDSLETTNGYDCDLQTTNDYNCYRSLLDTLNDTPDPSLVNLDFSDEFDSLTRLDSSDSSQWSTLSSGINEFPLDWDEVQGPLSLEEYYNRTFNETLQKVGPCQPDACSFYQTEHVDIGQWSSVRLDTEDYCNDVNACENDNSLAVRQSDSQCPEISNGHEQSLSESSNKAPSDGRKPETINTEHRLALVRKYQRLNTNRPTSELLERNFQCNYPTCLKFYAKLSHLKAHLRRHSGERAFKCDWQDCAWQFSRSDELSRHRRSHYGIKPYPCTQCVKRFTRSDHLAKHLKVHERQKYKMMMKSLRKPNKKK